LPDFVEDSLMWIEIIQNLVIGAVFVAMIFAAHLADHYSD